MTTTPVAATPYDPLLTYQFRVQLLEPPADATPSQSGSEATSTAGTGAGPVGSGPRDYVAGVRRVSGLALTVAATETWEGGNSLHRHANPHRAVWEPIVLEQGISLDTTLQAWAEAGIAFLRTGTVEAARPVKRNLLLDVYDPGKNAENRPRARYLVFNAWVSKYQAVPRLDAMADEVALLSVELTHHGWRREPAVGPPPPLEPDLFATSQ